MILIISEQPGSQCGLPEGLVGGRAVGQRTYQAVGNYLPIDGDDELLISEDAATILAFPGFRLALPEEQNSYAASQSGKSGKLTENGKSKAGKANDGNINGG